MKQMSLRKAAIATSAFACAALFSFGWSEQSGVSLSVESAQARIGHPLTPLSGAGVARRTYRRAAYGGVVGAGLGVAAVGTAAAVAATQPWGWNNGYYGRPYAGAYYGGYNPGWGGGSYCTPGTRYFGPDNRVLTCR